jgi:hypothetical protein
MISADPLKRLPQIQSEINALKAEFHRILDHLRGGVEAVRVAAAAPVKRGRKRRAAAKVVAPKVTRRRGRRSPLRGKKRPASPSGPLAPAVVKVLKAAGKPQNVNAVLEGLKKAKYVFTAKDAKKNLAARIYKLSGVKQVGPGLFAAGK